ncbi:MAG: UDP-N-acetylmuramoylalanyl-D-glutamyl-2, 6-diaminopimelate--D-alanyl-D-alanine ligase, partial [Brevundimonas sp.]
GLSESLIANGIDVVHAAGPQMRLLYDILPPAMRGQWRETAAELARDAALLVSPDDIVMVKGSNGSRAAIVAKALAELEGAAE